MSYNASEGEGAYVENNNGTNRFKVCGEVRERKGEKINCITTRTQKQTANILQTHTKKTFLSLFVFTRKQ